jgi:hypothetical protein
MNQTPTIGSTTARLPHISQRDGEMSVMHFKRFLEAFSAPMTAPVAHEVRRGTTFRVLHVKRTLAEPAVLALVGLAVTRGG